MLTVTITNTIMSKTRNAGGGGGIPPSNTVAPVISGSSVIGSTLSSTTGTWVGDPVITYSYQWKRAGVDIVGEINSTYVLVAADYNQAITCEVTATNAFGTASATSNSITGTATAPVNTVAPVISGTAVVGQTLSSTTGTWTGTPIPTYTYQWYRGISQISGATSSTYTLVQADATFSVTCEVTATNIAGVANATSNALTIIDADAQAFFTASGLTGTTNQSAINQLVVDLKGFGIWTKMKAIYPMVGGTAALHKWNLKDPRDLDAAFRLVFSGGMTHSSTGIAFGGVNGFANTFLTPSTNLTLNSTHLSYYSRTNVNLTQVEIGCYDNTGAYTIIEARTANISYFLTNTSTIAGVADTNSAAFYIGNRTATTVTNGFRNNVKIFNSAAFSTFRPVNNIYIGAANNASSIAQYFTTKECAFSSIGEGLSDTEAANFYLAVQNYNTSLSRQV